ncbi:unnamed protein product [marine sediment metagenome]|uniref:Uncharacterized protein n=1 Tax=marine sediment metagenome TaxID=412755 RepID=X1GIJ7_9ZZZZ
MKLVSHQRPAAGRAGFRDRVALHEREMLACEIFLTRKGFVVERLGQEVTPGQWQEVARKLHSDETAREERFKPDLMASHARRELLLKVEVKSRNPDSPNIAIEKACHDNALVLRSRAIRLTYWFPGERMAWPEELPIWRVVNDPVQLAKAKRRGGAGTPYILIRDADVTMDADTFIEELICERQT